MLRHFSQEMQQDWLLVLFRWRISVKSQSSSEHLKSKSLPARRNRKRKMPSTENWPFHGDQACSAVTCFGNIVCLRCQQGAWLSSKLGMLLYSATGCCKENVNPLSFSREELWEEIVQLGRNTDGGGLPPHPRPQKPLSLPLRTLHQGRSQVLPGLG